MKINNKGVTTIEDVMEEGELERSCCYCEFSGLISRVFHGDEITKDASSPLAYSCRYKSPTAAVSKDGTPFALWPVVNENDWCSKFRIRRSELYFSGKEPADHNSLYCVISMAMDDLYKKEGFKEFEGTPLDLYKKLKDFSSNVIGDDGKNQEWLWSVIQFMIELKSIEHSLIINEKIGVKYLGKKRNGQLIKLIKYELNDNS